MSKTSCEGLELLSGQDISWNGRLRRISTESLPSKGKLLHIERRFHKILSDSNAF